MRDWFRIQNTMTAAKTLLISVVWVALLGGCGKPQPVAKAAQPKTDIFDELDFKTNGPAAWGAKRVPELPLQELLQRVQYLEAQAAINQTNMEVMFQNMQALANYCAAKVQPSPQKQEVQVAPPQQPAATVPITQQPQTLPALLIYGGSGHRVFLGCLNCDSTIPASILNESGQYGKSGRYNEPNIWNEYGTFGSKFSDSSPWNRFAEHPPIIVDQEGNSYGYFTANTFHQGRTKIPEALLLIQAKRD